MRTLNLTKLVMAFSLSLLVTACSSSNSGSDADPTPKPALSTGVLSDSPVDGVTYSINGAAKGVTADGGKFQYTLGDTVTFTLGALTLGEYTPKIADAVVTPIELTSAIEDEADNRGNTVTNLLILLQSLDADGDPENGISISAETLASFADAQKVQSLILSSDSSDFSEALTNANVLPEGKTAVSAEAAEAHFKKQFFNNLAGVYYFDNYGSVLRINNDGNYLVGQFIDDDEEALGVEYGTFHLDDRIGFIRVEVKADYQINKWNKAEGAGFNGAEDLRFVTSSTGLGIVEIEDGQEVVYSLKRLVNGTGNSIVGAWANASTPKHNPDKSTDEDAMFDPISITDAEKLIHDTTQFVFFADGTYVMFDLVGDDHAQALNEEECASKGGIEIGKYSLDGNSLTVTRKINDTNGCGGLMGDDGWATNIEFEVEGDTMYWHLDDEYTDLFPLKRVKTDVLP